ncbi:alpha/beta fold hydrolase [Flavobacterium sp.]|uniref:alpha/beta fold hydrolase n=1 Tax=Flavobacterium sp. TaxID=239 RepID=UPI003265059D
MKKLKLIQLVIVACIFILSSCSNDDKQPENPKNYVIVHGAWQAPYAWQTVKANLEKEGNNVIVVELPGHGNDHTSPSEITMDTYKEKVIDAISAVDGKVILVGHSLGGMIISSVAEAIPEKIEKLIYVAAYLPVSGQTLDQLANMDPDSQLGVPTIDPVAFTIDVQQDQIVNLFIQDGTPAIQSLVVNNYRTEPLIPFINPVTLTEQNFGSVKKAYIKTLQDHVVSPYLQNKMISTTEVESVYEINTGHSPFLSQPNELSSILTKIATN